ncbi:MAG: 50S ribosomal protein L29 [Candidatus Margulisiibacteriota bacterium]
MKIKDIQSLSDDDLNAKVIELKNEYFEKRLAILNNTSNDTSILNKLRKDTARVKTIISERKNK